MKKFLPEKITHPIAPSILSKAKAQMVRLLPDSGAKSAVQLPVPRTPFDHYRKNKLIKLLKMNEIVEGKSVLEIGCGIGDLLLEINKYRPRQLFGIDSSEEAIGLARQFLGNAAVELMALDVKRLPFPEKSFDVVVVMFELQHLTDEKEVEKMIYEACRVTRQWLIVVEDTAPEQRQREGYVRRPVQWYKEAFREKHFFLRKTDFLDVSASRYVFTGRSNPWHWLRWLLSPLLYLMGFPKSWMKPPVEESELPTSKFAMFLQKLSLPFMTSVDELVKTGSGTTVMRFERERLFRRG